MFVFKLKSQSLSILNYLRIKFKKKLNCDSLKFCIILKSMIVAAKLLEFYSITQQSLNDLNITLVPAITEISLLVILDF